MSLHPSLKVDTAGAQQRTVLSRIERIKDLMKKGLWSDDQLVTNLPKTKIVKIKAQKKEKAEDTEDAPKDGVAATEAKAEESPKK
ncbi:MAG: small basic protein [Candidatus Zapsychrus exili]|nr:small basic protein [Candidatus Zapsychrus exili]